jgi:hypothetical protein
MLHTLFRLAKADITTPPAGMQSDIASVWKGRVIRKVLRRSSRIAINQERWPVSIPVTK